MFSIEYVDTKSLSYADDSLYYSEHGTILW